MKLSDFWLREYLDASRSLCGLCGNTGIIDTTGARTPAGVDVGGRYYCLCPNGRILKRVAGLPDTSRLPDVNGKYHP